MKAIIIGIVSCLFLLTSYAHAKPATAFTEEPYCDQHPLDCKLAARWCAEHEGKRNACKLSPEEYCPNNRDRCRLGH